MKSIQGDRKEILVEHDDSYYDYLPAWFIASSSGHAGFRCTAVSESVKDDCVLCSIRLHGDFWQRDQELSEAALTKDFEVLLHQVIVSLPSLEYLYQELEQWEAGKELNLLEITPVGRGGQRLSFSFGCHSELIYSVSKPACTIAYSLGASMTASWSFVVDQSCIRLCVESIKSFLGGYSTKR